jgi:NitT/TauT family transport system substrate-binding protein
MKLVHLFAGPAMVAGLLFSLQLAHAQELVNVRAAFLPAVTWLPSWVALENGIFKKNGLNVSLTEVQNVALLPGTLGRQFDIAPSTPPDLIKGVANGLSITGVAGGYIEASDARMIEVMVLPDSGIKGPTDLKGKLIATPTVGSIMHVATLQWLESNGVSQRDIRAVEVPFPNMPDQLLSGRLDAVEAIEPFVSILKDKGAVGVGDPVLSVTDPAMSTIWISDRDWAHENPEVIEKWVKSIDEAIAFIKANESASRAIVAKYTKLPPPVVSKLRLPAYKAELEAKDIRAWVDVLSKLGQMDSEVSDDSLVLSR